jgi:hypothetical protein
MIGTTKLSTIREQIQKALAAGDADPIERLERCITSTKRKGERADVMEGLKSFLDASPKRKQRKRGAAGKKLSDAS